MEAKEMEKTASKSNETVKTASISSTTISSGHPTTDTNGAFQPPQNGLSTLKSPPPLPTKLPSPSSASIAASLPAQEVSKMPSPAGGALKLPPQNGKNVTMPQHYIPNARVTAPATAARPANSGNDRVTVDRVHKPLVPPVTQPRLPNIKQPAKMSPSTPASFQPPAMKQPAVPSAATAAAAVSQEPHAIAKIIVPVGSHPSAASRVVPQPGKVSTIVPTADIGDNPGIMAPPAQPPPPVLDETALIEEAIRKARAPLTDMYAPFIVPSDRTLKEARSRLRKAIEQTGKLRAAFTERVYGKYRVCLRPPPTKEQIFNRVMSDPSRTHRELEEQIKQLKAEKEVEKKEAQKLNAELTAANSSGEDGKATAAAVNAETAEQLMFISAGLSLIILPEHDVAGKIDMSRYPDRAPLNPETGQRVRSISAAAAAAGEVMLDRARKGATMRIERQRRRQLQIIAGEDPEKDGDSNYSRLSLLSNAPRPVLAKPMMPPRKVEPATVKAVTPSQAATMPPAMTPKANFKRQAPKPATPVTAPIISAKAIRARVQATMSNNTLLSLNPSAEELRTDGKCGAATMAMMEQGVGAPTGKAAQQQRYRHPFPNSIGARRRAFAGTSNNNVSDPKQLNLALPPLLAAKERRLRKPVRVFEASYASTERANDAIRGLLEQYVVGDPTDERQQPLKKRRRTEISFLHGLEYSEQNLKARQTNALSDDTMDVAKAIDPFLTFNVLKAVGLIKPSVSDADVTSGSILSVLDPTVIKTAEKRALGEDGGQSQSSISMLKELRNKFLSKKRAYVDAFLAQTRKSSPNPGTALSQTEVTLKEAADGTVAQANKGETVSSSIEQKESAGVGKRDEPLKGPQSVSIRGGGQEVPASEDKTETTSEVKMEQHSKESQASETAMQADRVQQNTGPRSINMTAASGNSIQASRHMVLLNPQLARVDQAYRRSTAGHQSALVAHGNAANNTSHTNRVQSQPRQASDSYHHPSAASALQLAHQLQHASASMQRLPTHAPGELEAFIGGLHAQSGPASYDWSQMAALGINPHQAAMMNFSGRARALIARGQQNAAAAAVAHAAAAQRALMGGAYGPGATARFPHVSGHAALMNSSAALMGHTGMAPMSQSAQVVNMHQRENDNAVTRTTLPQQYGPEDTKDIGSKMDLKDDTTSAPSDKAEEAGRKRKLSSASSDSSQSEKRRNLSKTNSVKREGDTSKMSTPGSSNLTSPPRKIPEVTLPVKSSISGSKSIQNRPSLPSSFQAKDAKQISKPTPTSRIENGKSKSPPQTSGMQFYVPPAPPGIPSDMASLILASRAFEAIEAWESGEVAFDATAIIEYVLAVGIAVPIPKALVLNPLKERVGATGMKNNPFSNIPASSREVIVALILLWLWKHHEDCFQKTFAKSGRIDVDPECKWLINAAVDRSVAALSQELSKPGSPLNAALTLAKSKGGAAQKVVQGGDVERSQGKTTKVDLLSAAIVSKSLLAGTCIDEKMDSLLPNFHDMLQYLDECRTCTLHSKAQERGLLAALISRKATMSLPFSHAYASSMVRAGEAVGHGELFEVVQNEDVKVSTMIPYDVFTDESGSWEDPCRPPGHFTAGLTGDDLMRRAHARAMIQKSLRKLQDRHNIKGGAPNPGPYTDPPTSGSNTTSDGNRSQCVSIASSTPRGWLKRRPSFSEPKIQPGTGSAQATSISLYEPKHRSSPLDWRSDDPENLPYGSFSTRQNNGNGRKRALSHGQASGGKSPGGSKKVIRSISVGSFDERKKTVKDEFSRSTHEIVWTEVANAFESQNVQLKTKKRKEMQPVAPRDKTIFAPFVRRTELTPIDSDSESDTEEDLSDKKVLMRHQEVLDDMKQKLSLFFEARKKTAERKKKKDSIKKV